MIAGRRILNQPQPTNKTMNLSESYYKARYDEIADRSTEISDFAFNETRNITDYSSLDQQAKLRMMTMLMRAVVYIRYGGEKPKELGGGNVSVQ